MVSKVLKKQWATSKDWAAHRETISRMYRDMELEDLMALMERKYHFYSTYDSPERPQLPTMADGKIGRACTRQR